MFATTASVPKRINYPRTNANLEVASLNIYLFSGFIKSDLGNSPFCIFTSAIISVFFSKHVFLIGLLKFHTRE